MARPQEPLGLGSPLLRGDLSDPLSDSICPRLPWPGWGQGSPAARSHGCLYPTSLPLTSAVLISGHGQESASSVGIGSYMSLTSRCTPTLHTRLYPKSLGPCTGELLSGGAPPSSRSHPPRTPIMSPFPVG